MTQGLPLTYADLVCEEDLDLFASETSSDFENLVQDVMHIMTELPGSNPDDPKRGVGIELYLSGTLDNLRGLPGIIETQLTQDDRIEQCSTEISQLPSGDWSVITTITVSGNVIPLAFTWSSVGGLVFQDNP